MIDAQNMFRVVKSPEGGFSLDKTGKSPGRGAYLCKSAECLPKAVKSRGFDRSFKKSVPAEIYKALEGAVRDE